MALPGHLLSALRCILRFGESQGAVERWRSENRSSGPRHAVIPSIITPCAERTQDRRAECPP